MYRIHRQQCLYIYLGFIYFSYIFRIVVVKDQTRHFLIIMTHICLQTFTFIFLASESLEFVQTEPQTFVWSLHPNFHFTICSKNFLLKSNLSQKTILDIVLSLSIRKLIHWIVTKKLFDNFIMLVILVNILNVLNIMNMVNIRNTMVVILVSILNTIINRNTMLVILVNIPFP